LRRVSHKNGRFCGKWERISAAQRKRRFEWQSNRQTVMMALEDGDRQTDTIFRGKLKMEKKFPVFLLLTNFHRNNKKHNFMFSFMCVDRGTPFFSVNLLNRVNIIMNIMYLSYVLSVMLPPKAVEQMYSCGNLKLCICRHAQIAIKEEHLAALYSFLLRTSNTLIVSQNYS
jgi:hypothetical protein